MPTDNNNKQTISIESDYGKKVTSTLSAEADIFEMIEAIGGLLVAAGFHSDSVDDGMVAWVEEHVGNNDDCKCKAKIPIKD